MSEGLFFGFIAWLSIMITWNHLPAIIKLFSLKHPILSDVFITFLTYMTISSITHSLIGAIASMVSGLLVELSFILIKIGHKHQWIQIK